jgi:hypothetical protein
VLGQWVKQNDRDWKPVGHWGFFFFFFFFFLVCGG